MPDCYSTYDWSRSYLLPGHITANIPRRGAEGDPGAYNNARGLLVEICRATGAHPVALHYADTFSPDTGLTRTTALARLPERIRPLLVRTSGGIRCAGSAAKHGRAASTTHTSPPRTAAFLPRRPGRPGSSPAGYLTMHHLSAVVPRVAGVLRDHGDLAWSACGPPGGQHTGWGRAAMNPAHPAG